MIPETKTWAIQTAYRQSPSVDHRAFAERNVVDQLGRLIAQELTQGVRYVVQLTLEDAIDHQAPPWDNKAIRGTFEMTPVVVHSLPLHEMMRTPIEVEVMPLERLTKTAGREILERAGRWWGDRVAEARRALRHMGG
jgi:hypothetical protein